MRLSNLSFAALLFVALSACTEIDRGKCFETKVVHHGSWVQLMPVYNGQTTTFIPIVHPARDEIVCVRWEYPDGKPKK